MDLEGCLRHEDRDYGLACIKGQCTDNLSKKKQKCDIEEDGVFGLGCNEGKCK